MSYSPKKRTFCHFSVGGTWQRPIVWKINIYRDHFIFIEFFLDGRRKKFKSKNLIHLLIDNYLLQKNWGNITKGITVNESILFKRLVDNAFYKHYGINQKKNRKPHKFRINKVCVASLTKFYTFLKLCYLKSFSKKIIKKMKNANGQNSSILWRGIDKG